MRSTIEVMMLFNHGNNSVNDYTGYHDANGKKHEYKMRAYICLYMDSSDHTAKAQLKSPPQAPMQVSFILEVLGLQCKSTRGTSLGGDRAQMSLEEY